MRNKNLKTIFSIDICSYEKQSNFALKVFYSDTSFEILYFPKSKYLDEAINKLKFAKMENKVITLTGFTINDR